MIKKEILLIFPIVFLILYYVLGWFFNVEYTYIFKPYIIPTFLIYVYAKFNFKLGLNFYLFALLYYVGETLLLYSIKFPFLIRFTLIVFLFSYISAIKLVLIHIKHLNLKIILQRYTLFIIVINSFFLVLILFLLESMINDIFINYIIVLNAITALIFGFSAVLYLNESTHKKAFFYFFGAFSIILSDIFGALNNYFYESFVLNLSESLLHFLGFLFIFLFVTTNEFKKLNY
jgi:hypothetical protein